MCRCRVVSSWVTMTTTTLISLQMLLFPTLATLATLTTTTTTTTSLVVLDSARNTLECSSASRLYYAHLCNHQIE